MIAENQTRCLAAADHFRMRSTIAAAARSSRSPLMEESMAICQVSAAAANEVMTEMNFMLFEGLFLRSLEALLTSLSCAIHR